MEALVNISIVGKQVSNRASNTLATQNRYLISLPTTLLCVIRCMQMHNILDQAN